MPTTEEVAAAQVARLLADQLRRLKDQTYQELIFTWLDMDYHNKSDIPVWLDRAIPVVRNSFEVALETTRTMNEIQAEILAVESLNDGFDLEDILQKYRNGVPIEEVYQRPFVNFWSSVQNQGVGAALDHSSARIGELIDSDIERVSDLTQIETFANVETIVGYRRVLVGPRNCALCIVASTQRYKKRDLKPMHPHCDCKVSPVLSFESDGDQILDQDLLDQIHADIEAKFGVSARDARQIDYRKILVENNHGELGPYMSYRGQKFTGPNDI